MITRVRPTIVKKGRSAGEKMAMLTIEDHTGSIDGVVFSDAYAISGPLISEDQVLMLRGKVDRRREEPSIVVDQVIPIQEAAQQLTKTVQIILDDNSQDGSAPQPVNGELVKLKSLLRQAAGFRQGSSHEGSAAQVVIEVHQQGYAVQLRVDGLKIAVDSELPQRIETVLQRPGCCQLCGPPKLVRAETSQPTASAPPQKEPVPTANAPQKNGVDDLAPVG